MTSNSTLYLIIPLLLYHIPSPTQPTQPSPRVEQHIPTPHDSPLHVVHSHGSDEDIGINSSNRRILSDARFQEKTSTETEPFYSRSPSTKVIQDQESSEKGSAEVSTAGATKGTASEVPVVSTAEENISTAGRTVTYTRRSEEQRKRKALDCRDEEIARYVGNKEERQDYIEAKIEEEDVDTQKEVKEVAKESGANEEVFF
ncbi:hypothetical protein Tco_0560739 [Tanacetum coccineum]